jgi:hypothetical protein
MSDQEFAAALSVIVSLLLLVGLAGVIRTHRIDSLRERLFGLRDEMFLYAHGHDLLSSPAYVNLRVLMNGLIRYAHQVSMSRLVLLWAGARVLGISATLPKTYRDWATAADQLPDDQRKEMLRFHSEAMQLMANHMLMGSPAVWLAIMVLWVGTPLILIGLLVVKPTKALVENPAAFLRRLSPSLDLMEAEAIKSAAQ